MDKNDHQSSMLYVYKDNSSKMDQKQLSEVELCAVKTLQIVK